MSNLMDRLVLGAVKCTICGAGWGKCDCWQRCACGWNHERGKACSNPQCTVPRTMPRARRGR